MIEKITKLVNVVRGTKTNSPADADARTLVLPPPVTEDASGEESDETPEEKPAPVDLSDLPGPENPKARHEYIRERLQFRKEPYTPTEQALRKIAHDEQQGSPNVQIDPNQHRVEVAAAINSADRRRSERISKLQSALAGGDWLPMMPGGQTPDPILEYMGTLECLELVKKLRPALAYYEIEFHRNYVWLNPISRAKEHAAALHSNPSDEQMAKIATEEALLKSDHFKTVASSRAAGLRSQYIQNIRPLVRILLRSALLFLTESKLAAIAAEIDFLEQNGAEADDWKPTAASTRFDDSISKLKHAIEQIENPICVAITVIGAPDPVTPLKTVFHISTHPDGD